MALSPIRPKGPPLNALRAFEAAARLGGFAAAAEELCVTAGAVGQQVKKLEQWVEAPLFERASQGVALTALGVEMAVEFGDVFDRLGLAVQAMRIKAKPKVVRIAALPSVAQLWLSPLLPAIRVANEGVTISITVLERAPNLQREQFDLSLFFQEEKLGTNAIALAREEIFPVCAAVLAPQLPAMDSLSDVVCLQDVNWSDDWQKWLGHAVPNNRLNVSGPSFSLYSLAVEEAKNGAGVLMGHSPLVDGLIACKDLMMPFKQRVETGRWLVMDSTRAFSQTERYKNIVGVVGGIS